MNGQIEEFEGFTLDIAEQRLLKNGEEISLSPKVFQVLSLLVKNSGRLVSHDELIEEVWKDTFVEDANIRFCIHSLRKALGSEIIETVPKRGYRFKPSVRSRPRSYVYGNGHEHNEIPEQLKKPQEGNDLEKTEGPKTGLARLLAIGAGATILIALGLVSYLYWPTATDTDGYRVEKSIAILPFKIQSGAESENNGIQDSLKEAFERNLSQLKGIRFSETKDLPSLGIADLNKEDLVEQVDSDFILGGTVRIADDNLVNINAVLRDLSDSEASPAKEFDIEARDLTSAERIISARVAREMFLRLSEKRDREFLATQEISEEAKSIYLTGNSILRRKDFKRRDEGVKLLKRLIDLEPDWAKGHGKYVEAVVLLHGGAPEPEELKRIVDKPLALDQNLAEAHLAKAWYHQLTFEWENAEESFRDAIRLNPTYTDAYLEFGFALDTQRKFAQAEKIYKQGLAVNPFDPNLVAQLCVHYYYDNKADLARKTCERALEIDPNNNVAKKNMFWIDMELNRYDSVLKEYYGHLSEKQLENHPAKHLRAGNISQYWRQNAENRVNNQRRRKSALAIAGFFARAGDRIKALDYLEQIPSTRPLDITQVNPNPTFDNLRNEPRFINLMKRFNLDPN